MRSFVSTKDGTDVCSVQTDVRGAPQPNAGCSLVRAENMQTGGHGPRAHSRLLEARRSCTNILPYEPLSLWKRHLPTLPEPRLPDVWCSLFYP